MARHSMFIDFKNQHSKTKQNETKKINIVRTNDKLCGNSIKAQTMIFTKVKYPHNSVYGILKDTK